MMNYVFCNEPVVNRMTITVPLNINANSAIHLWIRSQEKQRLDNTWRGFFI